ncbi:MAG: carboxylate-amine ligase [Gammaproteobacteria bacterium]|nr:carboxylate-amine ligase [Gammaproteobacteria bacterium]
MNVPEPSFTLGIEEEYLLVDKESRDLCNEPPPSMMKECEALCEGQVSPEFLRSQIEVGTRVCRTIKGARDDLALLRCAVIKVADKYGLAPIAASTHPFGQWHKQKQTENDRYTTLANDLQTVARRLLICGMHVHVGIEDEELRIDLMRQLVYFLPHLLALSCSSPFWNGYDTGLKSYRLTVFDGMPRTRLPEDFVSFAEYERHVGALVGAGIIEDATKIWWDIRPSARYPTLETRITDVCTRVDDAITIAAILVCLTRMLYRLRADNKRWRIYARMLTNENRWRAMRYSYDEGLVDFGKGQIIPYSDLLDEILELIERDAEELGYTEEVNNARNILERGTSAHMQLAAYTKAIEAGASREEALQKVVDLLIQETREGLEL